MNRLFLLFLLARWQVQIVLSPVCHCARVPIPWAIRWTLDSQPASQPASPYLNGHLKFWARSAGKGAELIDEDPLAYRPIPLSNSFSSRPQHLPRTTKLH